MAVVIDDRLLLDVVAAQAPPDITAELSVGGVLSTGSWYLLPRSGAGRGIWFRSPLRTSLDAEVAERVRTDMGNLPTHIGLLHPGSSSPSCSP